ncbi:Elongation factor-like GTPase 1, partial [Cichlidogyrus casuarinus]
MLQIPDSQNKTRVYIRVTAHPMPALFLRWIESRAKNLVSAMIKSFKSNNEAQHKSAVAKFYEEFRKLLQKLDQDETDSMAGNWEAMCDQLLAFAPDQNGPNALFSRLQEDVFSLQTAWGLKLHHQSAGQDSVGLKLNAHAKALLRGFQIAAESGPLCAEPMRGVVFILEEIFARQRHLLPLPEKLVQHLQKMDQSKSTEKEDKLPQSKEDEEIVKLLREKQLAARRREKLKQLDMDWLGEDDQDQEWCDYIDEMEDALLAPVRN